MNNSTLRQHLFDTLSGLRDEKNPMDIERAKAVVEVGKVIIDSVKVEVDMAKTLVSAHSKKEWKDDKVIETPAFFDETKRLN